MQRIAVLLACFVAAVCAVASTAGAADMSASHNNARPEIWRYERSGDALPFPRTSRSQSVYAASACWSGCQSYCTWGEAACLKVDAQDRCLKLTDRCDRYCQRECRARGGPYVAPLLGLLD